MLTKKQLKLLEFINHTIETTKIAPSFDEMKEHLGLQSKSGVHRMVVALEKKGYIERLSNQARAMKLLDEAENVLRSSMAKMGEAVRSVTQEVLPIAMVGRIAAGAPLEAVEEGSEEVLVPVDMLGKGDYFALKVVGDSMTGMGIMDGDTVVIERRENATNGEVVVALVDEYEATLKRLYRRDGMIELRAENPDYDDRILQPERVRVQGRLHALLRNY